MSGQLATRSQRFGIACGYAVLYSLVPNVVSMEIASACYENSLSAGVIWGWSSVFAAAALIAAYWNTDRETFKAADSSAQWLLGLRNQAALTFSGPRLYIGLAFAAMGVLAAGDAGGLATFFPALFFSAGVLGASTTPATMIRNTPMFLQGDDDDCCDENSLVAAGASCCFGRFPNPCSLLCIGGKRVGQARQRGAERFDFDGGGIEAGSGGHYQAPGDQIPGPDDGGASNRL